MRSVNLPEAPGTCFVHGIDGYRANSYSYSQGGTAGGPVQAARIGALSPIVLLIIIVFCSDCTTLVIVVAAAAVNTISSCICLCSYSAHLLGRLTLNPYYGQCCEILIKLDAFNLLCITMCACNYYVKLCALTGNYNFSR